MSVKINIGVAYNGKNIKRSWDDLRKLASVADTTSARIKVLGAQMRLVGQTMSGVGQSLSKNVTLPLVAVGAAAIRSSTEFDTAFTGVIKTVDATEEQLAAMRAEIRKMATQLPATASEIANVASAAGQLGIETDSIVGFTRVMIDLGETTNLTADEAATQFARFANILQTPQDAFDRLGSTVVALGNNLATTEAEILELGLRLAAAGGQIGLTEAQILAFAGALSSVGVEAEAGGSAFSRVFLDINSAVISGGEELENFAAIAGVTAQEFATIYRRDAAAAITLFVQGLREVRDSGGDVTAVLGDVGLDTLRVRDALGRAAGAGDLLTDALNLASGAFEENTALAREADLRYQSTGAQFEIFRNRVNDVGIELGDALAPALLDALDAVKPLIDAVKNAAEAFSEMPEEQQRVILALAGIVALAGPMLMFIGSLVTAVGTATIAFGGLSVAIAGATLGLSLVAAALAVVVTKSVLMSDEQKRAQAAARDNRIEQEKLAGVYGAQAQAAAEAAVANRQAADAARYTALAAAYAAGEVDHLASAGRSNVTEAVRMGAALERAGASTDGFAEAVAGAEGVGGAVGKVVRLTAGMRTALQEVNLLAAGMDNGGEMVAQFAREMLAAGRITDETSVAASQLAQVIRGEVDRALSDANRQLEEANAQYAAYRDAIAQGVLQGNELADAAADQQAAVERLTQAEREYDAALASGDPERIKKATEELEAATAAQATFLSFLQVGVDTAEAFADQIDALREAGASLEVVQKIAELGAETGGRIAAELLAGGAAAVEQANRLVQATTDAARRAGEGAAQQFHGAGVEAARQFVSAIEASIPALQSVLDRIADMIEDALGSRPDVDISGEQKPPSGGQAEVVVEETPGTASPPKPGRPGQILVPGTFLAEGGLVTGPTFGVVGEAGPELVIPLDRLGQMGGSNIVINVSGAIDPEGVARTILRTLRDAERRTGERLVV